MTDSELIEALLIILAKKNYNADRKTLLMTIQVILNDEQEMQNRLKFINEMSDMSGLPVWFESSVFGAKSPKDGTQ